jgi:hypothetical protein
MLEAGSRGRGQPPPPTVVYEALTDLDRDPARRWLVLLDDERPPAIVRAEPMPDASLLGHLRRRLNTLINANLRYTFGQ